MFASAAPNTCRSDILLAERSILLAFPHLESSWKDGRCRRIEGDPGC
jgi:hypothetical protein